MGQLAHGQAGEPRGRGCACAEPDSAPNECSSAGNAGRYHIGGRRPNCREEAEQDWKPAGRSCAVVAGDAVDGQGWRPQIATVNEQVRSRPWQLRPSATVGGRRGRDQCKATARVVALAQVGGAVRHHDLQGRSDVAFQ